jgi:hypothetical protein
MTTNEPELGPGLGPRKPRAELRRGRAARKELSGWGRDLCVRDVRQTDQGLANRGTITTRRALRPVLRGLQPARRVPPRERPGQPGSRC